MAYRNPRDYFQNVIEFDVNELVFLNSIRLWAKKHWSGKFGTPAQHLERKNLITKIKSELEIIQENYCAFCGLNLALAYGVHREHIAPQYKHPHYIFEPKNLVLACSFCNMHKGKRKTVLNDTQNYETTTFKIWHPYFDDYNNYLECDITGNHDLVFKIIGDNTEKTQETIDILGLNKPNLIVQRSAIIMKHSISKNSDPVLNELIRQAMLSNRKSN